MGIMIMYYLSKFQSEYPFDMANNGNNDEILITHKNVRIALALHKITLCITIYKFSIIIYLFLDPIIIIKITILF